MATAMVLVGEGVGLGFHQAFRELAVQAADEGQKRMANNDVAGALAAFSDSIRFDSTFLAGRLMRSMAYLRLSRWQDAVLDASYVIDQGHALAEAHAIRGIAHQGWFNASMESRFQLLAQQDLATAQRLNPSYVEQPSDTPTVKSAPPTTGVDWGTIGGFATSFVKGTAAVVGVIGMVSLPFLAKGINDSFSRSRRGGFDCSNCGTFIHGHGTGYCPRCSARTY